MALLVGPVTQETQAGVGASAPPADLIAPDAGVGAISSMLNCASSPLDTDFPGNMGDHVESEEDVSERPVPVSNTLTWRYLDSGLFALSVRVCD